MLALFGVNNQVILQMRYSLSLAILNTDLS